MFYYLDNRHANILVISIRGYLIPADRHMLPLLTVSQRCLFAGLVSLQPSRPLLVTVTLMSRVFSVSNLVCNVL